jgi:hypothetical protein
MTTELFGTNILPLEEDLDITEILPRIDSLAQYNAGSTSAHPKHVNQNC